MKRIVRIPTARITALALAMALALIPLSACSSGEEEAAAMAAERQAGLEALEQQQQEVQQIRDEIEDLREQLVAAESGEGEGDPAELRTRIETRNAELTDAAEAYNQALAEFINADPPVEGEPVPDATARAIAMKADEDIVLAREYITEAGDYARAISMYDAILAYSPDNPNVLEAKAEAESLRYMSEERFSQVEKGMTEAEVENLLGKANPRNRRTFEDVGRAAWYYPKSPDGDAAGVLFQNRDGQMVVYDAKWDAVAKQSDEDEDAG